MLKPRVAHGTGPERAAIPRNVSYDGSYSKCAPCAPGVLHLPGNVAVHFPIFFRFQFPEMFPTLHPLHRQIDTLIHHFCTTYFEITSMCWGCYWSTFHLAEPRFRWGSSVSQISDAWLFGIFVCVCTEKRDRFSILSCFSNFDDPDTHLSEKSKCQKGFQLELETACFDR